MTQESLNSKFETLIEDYKQLNVKTVIFSIFKLNLNILLFFSLTSFIVNSIEIKQVVGPSPNVMINSIILSIIISIIWLIYYAVFGEYGIPTGYVNRDEFNHVALEYYQKVLSLYDKIWKVIRRIHNLLSIFSITMFCYVLLYQNLNISSVFINEFFNFQERKYIACIVLLITSGFIPLSKKYLNQLFKELKQKFEHKFFTKFKPFLNQEAYLQNPNEHNNAMKKTKDTIKGLIIEAYAVIFTLTSIAFTLHMLYEKTKIYAKMLSETNENKSLLFALTILLFATISIVNTQMNEDC